jgi:hypothetical protein
MQSTHSGSVHTWNKYLLTIAFTLAAAIPALPSEGEESGERGLGKKPASRSVEPGLDKALSSEAPKILKKLRDHHYETVGVLKFGVQFHGHALNFNAGSINMSLADRLELSLLQANDAKHPLNIIENATKVAHDSRKLSGKRSFSFTRHVDDRETLLNTEYPLLWGKQKMKPDVLLTGDVILSKDNSHATIAVKAFDRTNPGKVQDIHHFEIKTDRTLLLECGLNFVVPRRLRLLAPDSDPTADKSVVDKASPDKSAADKAADKSDKAAADSVTKQADKKEPDVAASPDNPIEVTLMYQGMEYKPERDSAAGNDRFKVADPKEGDTVAIKIKNVGKDTVGVVLAVDGVSTLMDGDMAGKKPADCTKWILAPGDEYVVDGYYQSETGENVKKFKVLNEDDSRKKMELDPQNMGKITLAVFTPDTKIEKLKVEQRGLRRGLMASKVKPANLKEAQQHLSRSVASKSAPLRSHVKGANGRGIVVAEDDLSAGSTLTRVPFQYGPEPTVSMTIQYYQPAPIMQQPAE